MDFEKLKREEEEAMEAFYGKKEEVKETVEDQDEDTEDNSADAEETSSLLQDSLTKDEVDEVPAKDDIETPSSPEKNVSWKKRFTSFKASADSTIYELRRESAQKSHRIATLLEDNDSLKKEISKLEAKISGSVDPYQGVFTVEDEEVIGPEAVQIIKKAMKAQGSSNPQVEKLMSELEELKKEKREKLKDEYDSFKAKSLEDLKAKLSSQVSDWPILDTDPKFGEFIKGIDPISGSPRSKLFSSAIESGDVANVARFYKEYKALRPKSKEEILAAKVSPVSGGGETSEGKPNTKIYSINEYIRFMDEVARGKWRTRQKEAQLIERKFDLARVQGRLRG